jgi:aminoglycoside phosphotransferase family enzyme
MSFSTLEHRATACCAELSLNRRLAPDVYLGLVPLTATPSGYAIGGGGPIIDWLAVMRRLDERQTLELALRDHRISQCQVDRLAGVLSRFYSHASRIMVSPESYLATLEKALVCGSARIARSGI